MTEVWDNLTKAHGRKAVMNLQISDQKLDAETAAQIPVLREAIRPLLTGQEKTALDFGCGFGRFTAMLANLIDGRAVGFDPSAEMIAHAQRRLDVDFICCPMTEFFAEISKTKTTFDLILAFGILGEPGLPEIKPAAELCRALSPDGLIVVVDHVIPHPDPNRWWRFRKPGYYEKLFRACGGVTLEEVGRVRQLDDTMTIYAGRPTPSRPEAREALIDALRKR